MYELTRTLLLGSLPDFRGVRYVLSRPLNYLGPVDNKIQAMRSYKVALVVENSSEFLSEKLFDAWFAGCIPVYVGPKLELFDIPSGIAFEAKPNSESIEEAITLALQVDHHDYLENLRRFLLLPETRERWEGKNALLRVLTFAIS